MIDMVEAVEGFVQDTVDLVWHRRDGGIDIEPSPIPVIGGKLRQKRRLAAHESSFLLANAGQMFKITVPTANGFAMQNGYKVGVTDKFYPTRRDLLRDLAEIVKNEVVALVDEGVPYVQIDSPNYTSYVDESRRARMKEQGIDIDQALDDAIAADNLALQAAKRDGVILAVHLCRGNRRGRWGSEGSYEPIAEKLFSTLQADRFLLEYDSDRAGGFEPLRFVPRGKTVVLGLLTTKDGALESQDVLRRRIDEAARYVPTENLAISPQCGFASSLPGNPITWDEQRAKLEMVVDTARKAWG
jgi:5-methyltetrahydropteroyltriglutamate--homocysteine methyltransferase